MKQYKDSCTFIVKMEGIDGNVYEAECFTPEEAVKLENHHKSLGLYAWIEIKPS